jgi:uncharacterized cupin superfamily protein
VRQNLLTNVLLSIIAIALLAIALKPSVAPPPVHAQSYAESRLYIEPGVQMLRTPGKQVYGKVMIDLRTGDIWGFPTGSANAYPFNPTESSLQVSHPIRLGRFALEDTVK